MQQLCGLEITSSQVSRAAKTLDGQLEEWRQRPLGEYPYLILDARYEKVRRNGTVVSCAVLSAIGIDCSGRGSVLGVSVSLSEAEVHWRQFLADLQARGLHGVQMIVSDNHKGIKAACTARLSGVPWQRCQAADAAGQPALSAFAGSSLFIPPTPTMISRFIPI